MEVFVESDVEAEVGRMYWLQAGDVAGGNVDIGNSATTSFAALPLGGVGPRRSEPEIGRTIKANDAGDLGRSLACRIFSDLCPKF